MRSAWADRKKAPDVCQANPHPRRPPVADGPTLPRGAGRDLVRRPESLRCNLGAWRTAS